MAASRVRPWGPWSASKTAVARCLGSALMARPKRTSCNTGMPTIIANVSRSRRIWMNSFTTMAHNRASENSCGSLMVNRIPFHEVNEDVFQSGIDLLPLVGRGAKRCERPFERGRVAAADMQRMAKNHRLLHGWTAAELLRQLEQVRAGHRPGGEGGVAH